MNKIKLYSYRLAGDVLNELLILNSKNMSGKNETPRQKMIGMMYLVLTALLALNVSKSILDAFVTVDNGLEQTNESFQQNTIKLYGDFENALREDRKKVLPYYEAANKAKVYSLKMDKELEELKIELIMKSDNKTRKESEAAVKDLMLIDAKDQFDIPTHLMVGDGTNPAIGKARILKTNLNNYRDEMLGLIKDPKLSILFRENVLKRLSDLGIDTYDAKKIDINADPSNRYWETAKFYHNPIVATVCLLSQIQNQLHKAESMVVTELLTQVGKFNIPMDTLVGKYIARSNYIVQGDDYNAELFVAAFSKTQKPVILMGEGYDSIKKQLKGRIDSVPVHNGIGNYRIKTSESGTKSKYALIMVKGPTNEYIKYPVKLNYLVAKPAIIASPTQMNVLYVGLPNPIDISVSGFPAEKISGTINNGLLTHNSAEHYFANVKTTGSAEINVFVKDENGKTRKMGEPLKFRVKSLPTPVAMIGSKVGGKMRKNIFMAQLGIEANMSNFVYGLKYKVSKFTFSYIKNDGTVSPPTQVNGWKFEPQFTNMIKSLPNNTRIFIEDIEAKDEYNNQYKLLDMTFTLTN